VRLYRGERIQKQSREGRAGRGWTCSDVPANPDTVFATLQQFEHYNELIPTIRAAKIERLAINRAKAEYSLSKFMLRVNVVHSVDVEKASIARVIALDSMLIYVLIL
jgi:hypothetical protein